MRRTLGTFFLQDVKSLTIRNLYSDQSQMDLHVLPRPLLNVHVVDSSGERMCIFDSNHEQAAMKDTCNPTWTLSDLVINPSTSSKSELAKWRVSEKLIFSVFNVNVNDNEKNANMPPRAMLEVSVNLSELLYLGDVSLRSIRVLPFNAVFLITDDGLWATRETYALMQTLVEEKHGIPIPAPQTDPHKKEDDRLQSGGRFADSSTHLSDDDDDEDTGEESDAEDVSPRHRDRAASRRVISPKNKALGPSGAGKPPADGSVFYDELRQIRKEVTAAAASAEGRAASAALESTQKALRVEKLAEAVRLAELAAAEEELALADDLLALKDTSDLEAHLVACEKLEAANARAEGVRDSLRGQASKVRFILEARQLKLLSELQTIYPIELLRARTDGQQDRWTIRGLELPPFDCPPRDEEQLATVLGYIVHVVLLLSKYTRISLRYQLLYYSSRSMIRDHTVNQIYPLYRTNELERFRKGFLWLAKDIEQVMVTKGLSYDRSKDLLYNLQQIFINEMIPQFS
jgi:hypothetical protein